MGKGRAPGRGHNGSGVVRRTSATERGLSRGNGSGRENRPVRDDSDDDDSSKSSESDRDDSSRNKNTNTTSDHTGAMLQEQNDTLRQLVAELKRQLHEASTSSSTSATDDNRTTIVPKTLSDGRVRLVHSFVGLTGWAKVKFIPTDQVYNNNPTLLAALFKHIGIETEQDKILYRTDCMKIYTSETNQKRNNVKNAVRSKYKTLWMGLDKHKEYGHISADVIAKFRQGEFASQTEAIQEAFFFCMLTLMACVNSTWHRTDVQTHHLLANKTTASDEALVYWLLECYSTKWIAEITEEQAHFERTGQPFPKRMKGKGQHFSRTHLTAFINKEKQIKDSRNNSSDWCEAVQDEAKRRLAEERGDKTDTILDTIPEGNVMQNHNYPGFNWDAYTIDAFDVV